MADHQRGVLCFCVFVGLRLAFSISTSFFWLELLACCSLYFFSSSFSFFFFWSASARSVNYGRRLDSASRLTDLVPDFSTLVPPGWTLRNIAISDHRIFNELFSLAVPREVLSGGSYLGSHGGGFTGDSRPLLALLKDFNRSNSTQSKWEGGSLHGKEHAHARRPRHRPVVVAALA